MSEDVESRRPIRVAWLIKGLGLGGAERLLVSFAEARNRRDFIYETFYVRADKHHLVPQLRDHGIKVELIGSRAQQDVLWLPRLYRRLRRAPIDVLHVHSPLIASGARLVVRALSASQRPALVTTEHNVWSAYMPVTRLLNDMSFGLDDAHLAVSNQVVESMPPRRRGDVEVVVHGVPLAQLRAERRHRTKARIALGLHSDEIAIGTIANFRSDKAYPVLLRAAADVLASHGNVRFFSIGQGPLEAETRALRDRLGLGHRFELLGAREDATQLLSAFDIFVLASTREGLPVALMESLALSLPVVATAVGGTPSAIRDGVEGFLVPPNDPQRIAAALERLIDDAELRTRMSRASGERAELFDIVPAVRRTESIYRMLADSRRSRCRDARQ